MFLNSVVIDSEAHPLQWGCTDADGIEQTNNRLRSGHVPILVNVRLDVSELRELLICLRQRLYVYLAEGVITMVIRFRV